MSDIYYIICHPNSRMADDLNHDGKSILEGWDVSVCNTVDKLFESHYIGTDRIVEGSTLLAGSFMDNGKYLFDTILGQWTGPVINQADMLLENFEFAKGLIDG